MFYSQYVLTKKGPLAKIWLAAHMQSKLTKAMVFATDVRKAVDNIIAPEAPMALRLTSNLLLGVVRILSRKAKYLLQESSDAMSSLKLTFRKGAVTGLDLPADENNASFNAITLDDAPARAPLLDLDLLPRPGKRSIDRSHTSSFTAAERDITIDEYAGGLSGGMNDAFALDPEMFRERDEQLVGDEPLMFTPSRRTPGRTTSPAVASVLSIPRSTGSVELMRAGTPVAAATPTLGLESPEIARAEPPGTPGVETPRIGEGARDDEPVPPAPEEDDVVAAVPAEEAPRRESTDSVGDNGRVSIGDSQGDEGRLSLGGDDLMLDMPPGSPRDTQLPEGRPEAPTPHATQEEAPSQQPQRGRKRKVLSRVDEGKTELTPSEFRACIDDTSDLIRRPRAKRRAGTGGALPVARAEELLARPAIAMPAEMDKLFEQWYAAEELIQRVASPLSEGEAERRAAREAAEDVEVPRAEEQVQEQPFTASDDGVSRQASEHTMSRRSGEVSPGMRGSPVMHDEYLPPQMEMVEPEIPPIPPVVEEEVPPPPEPVQVMEEEREPEVMVGTLAEVARTRVEVEQDGEERLTKRALKMHEYIRDNMIEEKFNLNDRLREEKSGRRVAARTFYEVLNLCSHRVVRLQQDEPYGDVLVEPVRPAFDEVAA